VAALVHAAHHHQHHQRARHQQGQRQQPGERDPGDQQDCASTTPPAIIAGTYLLRMTTPSNDSAGRVQDPQLHRTSEEPKVPTAGGLPMFDGGLVDDHLRRSLDPGYVATLEARQRRSTRC
jgi:hypothetical protein